VKIQASAVGCFPTGATAWVCRFNLV